LMVDRSVPMLKTLMTAISDTPASTLKLVQRETAQVEMQLQGYWLARQEIPGEGVFMMNLDPALEGHLVKIWQASQQDASCYS
jgi:hypothetical protein